MRRIVEIVWLALAAVCLVEAVINWQSHGFNHDNTYIFLLVFMVAVFMYFFRRYQRMKAKRSLDGGCKI